MKYISKALVSLNTKRRDLVKHRRFIARQHASCTARSLFTRATHSIARSLLRQRDRLSVTRGTVSKRLNLS